MQPSSQTIFSRILLATVALLAWGAVAFAGVFTDFQQVAIAAHLHTTFSDGEHRISEVARMAQTAGFQGIWVTDHTDIYWEYPALGTTVGFHRNSLLERGFDEYLKACRQVQRKNPDFIIIPGFEASPYYYWSGNAFGKRVTNQQWMKHLIVAGIEDPRAFHKLPMMGWGTSPFTPGFTNHGEAPYQAFVHAVQQAGGVAFWAHPTVDREHHHWRQVYSQVKAYPDSLLNVPESAGIAVRKVDDAIAKPGGIWDQAIQAYCTGQRDTIPGVMVEIDYHQGSFPGKPTLMLLLPIDTGTDSASRKQTSLAALKARRYYVTNVAPGEFMLKDFSLTDGDDKSAVPGEVLQSTGPVTIRYSLTAQNPLQWVRIIRNGTVVFESDQPSGQWVDHDAMPAGDHIAYRLAVQGVDGRYLLTNPVFAGLATGK